MFKVAAFTAFFIATSASQVQAQAVSKQAPDSATAAQAKPIVVTQTRKVCHTEIPTGSMLAMRVCRTETEVVQEQADARVWIESMARQQLNDQVQQEARSR